MATKTKKPATKKATSSGLTATAKKGTKKAAPAKEKKAGVIDSILEFLTGASAKQPLTKDQLVAKLAARFKDRDAKALRTTCNCQLGQRIEEAKKVKVHRNDDGGYWITK
jgi:hypothetical protein